MNTFLVINCRPPKVILATSSVRKAKRKLEKGIKIEIWADNECVDTVYYRQEHKLVPYIQMEKEYIGRKQKEAEERNKEERNRKLRILSKFVNAEKEREA